MNQALTRASSLAERELDNSARRMSGYAASIAARPDLVTAMAANDAARLRDILVSALAGLRALDPTVAVLEITDTSGRIMMRGHAPTRFGDDKSKVPDVAAALLGNPLLGSEVSPTSGQFATGAALPVKTAEGRIIGTIKVATRLTPAVVAELGKLVAGEAALFGAGQLVTSTVEGLKAENLPEVILNAQRQGEAISGLLVTLPGKGAHVVTLQPLRDLSGNAAGAMMIALPRAGFDAAMQKVLWLIGLAALAVLALAIPVSLIAAQRIARPLTDMAGVWPRATRRSQSPAVAELMRSAPWPKHSKNSVNRPKRMPLLKPLPRLNAPHGIGARPWWKASRRNLVGRLRPSWIGCVIRPAACAKLLSPWPPPRNRPAIAWQIR
ncbi:MAG: cache domain-containing protein, partial [Alphaproteobacteria bacterium]